MLADDFGRVFPQRQVVIKGKTASIKCFSKGKVRWTRRGGKKIRQSQKVDNVLELIDVKNKDTDIYVCHGTNADDKTFVAESDVLVGGKIQYQVTLCHKYYLRNT